MKKRILMQPIITAQSLSSIYKFCRKWKKGSWCNHF